MVALFIFVNCAFCGRQLVCLFENHWLGVELGTGKQQNDYLISKKRAEQNDYARLSNLLKMRSKMRLLYSDVCFTSRPISRHRTEVIIAKCCNHLVGAVLNGRSSVNGSAYSAFKARTSNNRVISSRDLYCCLLPQCETLRTFPTATRAFKSTVCSKVVHESSQTRPF